MKLFYLKTINAIFAAFLLFVVSAAFSTSARAAFKFTATSDVQGNVTELQKISTQISGSPPAFMIMSGDLTPTNSQLTFLGRLQAVMSALNTGGLGSKTFTVRGNHDLPDTATWVSFFNFGPISDPNSTAAKVGVTNYQTLNDNLTYSFDFQNSHFVGIDVPGNVNVITPAQIAWVDNDLKSAESRGLKHAFIFWHGALYYVDGHSTSVNTAFATMLNGHPIVTALINGHEHQLAHTTLDKSRVSQFTNITIEQFVAAGGGAGSYACMATRTDFCQQVFGYLSIEVLNDTQIKAQFYKEGQTTPIFDRVYTKGKPVTTPVPTSVPTITPRPSPSGSFNPDVNRDGVVNIIDIGILIDNYGKTVFANPNADINNDGIVNIIDIGIIIDNYDKPAPTSTPVKTATPKPVTPSPTPRPPTPSPQSTPVITPPPVAGSFNFTTWGDTEKSLVTLGNISNQAKALSPEFTLYTGDTGLGFPDGWKAAISGNNNNGMMDKTFVVRGNGDTGLSWSPTFDFASTAARIGAKNYNSLTEDQTYSFDYGNTRIIGIDTPGCGSPSSTQLSWMEARIQEAVNLNLTHVIMFKHGAMYYVANHTNCVASPAFVSLISKYPIVTAIIHGHEHLKSDIPFGPNDSRLGPMSHTFHQIITGGSGDNPYPCNASRLTGPNDYCRSVDGFGELIINGRQVTINFYETGVIPPFKTITFTK